MAKSGKRAGKAAAKQAPLLHADSITKIFGELRANDGVDLTIAKGEIHALLGENGAGKSTLVKIIFGSLQPNEGSLEWNGEKVLVRSPSEARALGIGMVFQHFSLFDALTVAENIALSFDEKIPVSEIESRAESISREYGLPLDPSAIVGDLSVGVRQRVEIIRCLMQDPSLIILDEPTSVLTPQEADTLFETLRRLADEGRSILYISHRLEEVKSLCSTATIMRHGKVVDACDPRKETAASLASKMVGADIADVEPRKSKKAGDVLLKVAALNVPAGHPFAVSLHDINLELRAGEIVGVAGIAGNGQGEFFEALSGETKAARADAVELCGTKCGFQNISDRRLLGAAFVPEERLGHGAVPNLSLSDNLLLSRHSSDADNYLGLGSLKSILYSTIRQASERVIKAMDVRKSGENPAAASLSGGNLQKFIVGRELDRNPKVLIVNQPTWGVDAGAAAFLRQSLIDLAASGSAVLMISQDLDELFEVADSITVMADGHLTEPVAKEKLTREAVGLLMTAETRGAEAA